MVYDQLARSHHPGQALYELRAAPEAPELDFFAWFEDRARIGGQVKGGPYSVDGTVWTLHTAHGPEHVPCPLTQTWDAAIAVRDAVYRVLGFKVFIIPVLLLTDTLPEPDHRGVGGAAPGQGALRVRRSRRAPAGTG